MTENKPQETKLYLTHEITMEYAIEAAKIFLAEQGVPHARDFNVLAIDVPHNIIVFKRELSANEVKGHVENK
ncbi:MAG: hypothetical protein WC365_10045 [Candidatus Babeliales bacterium]